MTDRSSSGLEIRDAPSTEADEYCRSQWPAYNADVGIRWDFRPGGFVAEREGQPVGAVTFHTVGGVGHLGQIVVAKNRQREGIGRSLFERFERTCVERGCHKLTLETAQWQAREFYARLGFAVVLERDGDRFGGTWFVMEKRLGDPPLPPVGQS